MTSFLSRILGKEGHYFFLTVGESETPKELSKCPNELSLKC